MKMLPSRCALAAAVAVLMAFVTVAAETQQERDAYEKRIAGELEEINPEALPVFREANQARKELNFEKAAELFGKVRELAPDYVHAYRRGCQAELELGHRARAIELCRAAVEKDGSWENLASLSMALGAGEGGSAPPVKDMNEALDLALKAVRLNPDNQFAQLAVCQAAIQTNNQFILAGAVSRLKKIAPDDAGTHYFAAISAVAARKFGEARAELKEANRLGLPEEAYRGILSKIDQMENEYTDLMAPSGPSQDTVDVFMSIGVYGGLIWIGGMIALLIVGWILSALTMRAARRAPSSPGGGVAKGFDAVLRRIYRLVLWLSCAYYYISIPVLLLLVVGAGGGIIYGFFSLGRIPIKLVAIIAIVVLITVFAILKSLFIRRIDEDPGTRLELSENPGLHDLLNEVAGRIGTRPVDSVYLTPGTEVAVMERGGMLKQLTGRSERCLILGVGVLEGMKLSWFKAVLAHEYGHFSNQDTAGGGFAIAVRRSLMTMAESLAQGGAATWYNPAWLFINGFYRVFLRISQGASRLQEVLADRWAAYAYGAEAFEQGLTHVIRQSIRFDFHAQNTLNEVVEQQKPLANLYAYKPEKKPEPPEIEAAVNEAVHAKPTVYDSHPAPADRFTWVNALGAKGTGLKPGDTAEAWTLFQNPDHLQREMTTQIRASLAMDGIAISA
jgi:tetratricopeptide (TPR) repeat protein